MGFHPTAPKNTGLLEYIIIIGIFITIFSSSISISIIIVHLFSLL